MVALSDLEIAELISCPKLVIDSARRIMRVEGAQKRADIKLESLDTKKQFIIFVRQSTEFIENFSIGLRYIPLDGTDSIILFRCNGPHGPSNGSLAGNHHPHPHVHIATATNLADGIRAERGAVVTTDYSELHGATRYFLDRIGFPQEQRSKCFPKSVPSLFDVEGI